MHQKGAPHLAILRTPLLAGFSFDIGGRPFTGRHLSIVSRAEVGITHTGPRVSLDSVVHSFWNGTSAEAIAQSYPELTLEQVYGTIAYYLAHQELIDEYIRQGEADYDRKREAARQADPMFYQRMADARRRMKTPA